MKLNKVLALALSGVMAVSMLAGCSGNPGNGGQGGEEEQTPATIQIAADVNDLLSEDNQKKVTFTDSGELQNQLATAIALNGIVTLPDANNAVQASMEDLTGLKGQTAFNNLQKTDGKSYETVLVRTSDTNVKQKVAVEYFVENELDVWLNQLPYAANGTKVLKSAEDVEDLAEGTVYTQYAYTGNVAMVEVTNVAGTTSRYYFAVTIARTATAAIAD